MPTFWTHAGTMHMTLTSRNATSWVPMMSANCGTPVTAACSKGRPAGLGASLRSGATGYSSAGMLHRAFRRLVGVPPGAYRERFRVPTPTPV